MNKMKVREAEFQWEINNQKDKISEYKMIQIDDAKYKMIVKGLVEKE